MTYKIIFCFLFCVLSIVIHAEKVYDFNLTCQQAYKEIISLRINNGVQLINQARQQNPNNLIPDLLDGYVDFFVLFFNEDPAEYKLRKPHFDERLDRFDDGDESSPYYKFCKSVYYLQKATIEIKFSERWHAGWDFKRAFSLIKQNRKDFPAFKLNDMIYGATEVVVGVIPDGYRWFTSLFGMKGSVKDGMRLMQGFLASDDATAKLFEAEAIFYYCNLLFHIQNQPEQALQLINQRKLDVVNNQLFTYLAANLNLNYKQTETAKNIILNRNPSSAYLQTAVWDYEMAFVKLHHLELNDAVIYFNNFLHNFKGRFYVKDSYQKLSWCYYLLDNDNAANAARQQLLKRGSTDTDADKQANREAKTGIWPNKILLKARLLNDGGYHNEALIILQGKNTNDFTNPEEKLEFTYRVARIYDDLGRYDDAIKTYNSAINLGQNRTEYFASRAALQIGNIYEKQGKKDLAVAYYNKCLDMKDHDFKDSIDQKAKAGIARCEGK